MSVTYNSQELRNRLMLAAREAAGELTGTFFETVDRLAPVENGHLHQTLGTALSMSGAENTEDVASGMLAKGSGDQTATSLAFGTTQAMSDSVRVTVGTNVGFVSRLNDGDLVEPNVDGADGFKVGGAATMGVLYAPRKDSGPTGFLMWYSGGQPFFTRMAAWEPLGFFEEAAVALRNKATEMGLT